MKLTSQSHIQLVIQKTIFLVLFIVCIGMLAWISNFYVYQFDLTANKRHSLSESSIDLLSKLDQAITINAYTTDEITKKAVREIISRYQRIKSDFHLRLLNPDIDIEQAQKDGVVMNHPFAFVIHYNNRMEHIISLSEQAISNALLRLNRRDNQKVVFLSGHGERDIGGAKNNTDKRAYNNLRIQLTDMGFNLQAINLQESGLPTHTKLLVIAAASKPYLGEEIELIKKFISNGGNLLWLIDPGSSMKGLKTLATSLGLQIQDGIIIDYNSDLRKTLNIKHPAVIPVTEYFPHAVTNTIRYNTLFPLSRGISPLTNEDTVNNWKAEALFNSLARSWSETGKISDEMIFNSESGDIAGPITMAVALQRNVNSDNTQDKSQRVVVVGDSDFMSDKYIGSGANLNLGLNIFNWLIGDDDFISIKVSPSPDTKLELNDNQLMIIGFGFFLVIPILLLSTGFYIWHKRKKM